MLLPLRGFDHSLLSSVISAQYGLTHPGQPEFVPAGEDSWAYVVGDLWVSVRRDLRGHSPGAYESAARLRAGGLEFVLAPLVGADGQVSREVHGHPVVVFPYVPATVVVSLSTSADVARASDVMRRLHSSPVDDALPCEAFVLPFENDLWWALEVAQGARVDTGCYGPALQQLINNNSAPIVTLLSEYHDLAETCRLSDQPFVVSHGEPGTGNMLHTGSNLLLADWGELMLGPPERDLFHLKRSFGIDLPGRPEFFRFYEIRWLFNELTEYATRFFNPHSGDVQDASCFDHLLDILPLLSGT